MRMARLEVTSLKVEPARFAAQNGGSNALILTKQPPRSLDRVPLPGHYLPGRGLGKVSLSRL